MPQIDEETQRRILNRLKRAYGQLGAVIAGVEGQKPCKDVVTQLAAVSSALDKAGFAIIASAMQECVNDPANPDKPNIAELEKLFLSLA